MYIRQAKEKDLPELIELINSHVLLPNRINDHSYISSLKQTGFLVGQVTLNELLKDLHKVFLIVKEQRHIIGYIRIDEEIDGVFMDLDTKNLIEWVHKDFKKKYYFKNHFEVGGILVLTDYGRRNIGHDLLHKALVELKYKNLQAIFSFVPIHPVANEPSLKFHLKNGFKIIAKLKPVKLWGMDNYQSVLLMKELKDWKEIP
jgi:N-acetylglutamate synthase-like GNAT family acetyltransferase